MWRKIVPAIVAVAVVITLAVALLLPSHRYACIVLAYLPGLPSDGNLGFELEGRGDPQNCRLLLDPPGVYVGPRVAIPENAAVFAVLAVTDGETIRAIPLHTWKTEGGATEFGCNGPSPHFARKASDLKTFLRTVLDAVKRQDGSSSPNPARSTDAAGRSDGRDDG